MSFDPTKPVMPTCGGEAIIHSTSGPYITKTGVKMPIIASIKPTDYLWELSYFRADGGFCADGSKHPFDLINIPEEKWRPWTPEEVPVGALYRSKHGMEFIITGRRGDFEHSILISEVNWARRGWQSFTLDEGATYSTDLGKTWQPAGVKIQ